MVVRFVREVNQKHRASKPEGGKAHLLSFATICMFKYILVKA